MTFKSNYANRGGAVCVVQSVLTFTSTSVVVLSNNRAAGDGEPYILVASIQQHLTMILPLAYCTILLIDMVEHFTVK